jgi:hypothetical protein
MHWGEEFAQELIAAKAYLEKQAACIPYLRSFKQRKAIGILNSKNKR